MAHDSAYQAVRADVTVLYATCRNNRVFWEKNLRRNPDDKIALSRATFWKDREESYKAILDNYDQWFYLPVIAEG